MGVIPASENEFPSLLFAEGAAPATPASGLVICYAKSDGLIYCKDDAGTETAYGALPAHLADTDDAHDASAISILDTAAVFTATNVETALKELYDAIAGGGISPTIADAKGDLIVASANDTVDNLTVGTDGQVLTADSAQTLGVKWATPAGTVPWSLVPEGGAQGTNVRSVGTANRAIYVPATLQAAATITGCRITVGVQSGNISVGLYSGTSRVATSGAVACPAAGVADVNFTGNYSAAAGRYYIGLSCDNTTATFAWTESSTGGTGPATSRFEASAHPLPATATFNASPISTPAIIARISGGHP